MCVHCDLMEKKFNDHFENGMDDIRVTEIFGKIQKSIIEKSKSELKNEESKKSISGAFISIHSEETTLLGKKDISVDVLFNIIIQDDKISTVVLKMVDIYFSEPGTLSDDVLDRISELKELSKDKSAKEFVI